VEAFREEKNNTMVCFEQLQTVPMTHYANFQPEQNLQKGRVYT